MADDLPDLPKHEILFRDWKEQVEAKDLDEAEKVMGNDPFYYARKHENGPGAWCVRGPNGFEIAPPNLDKAAAYVIGKTLSGRYAEAAKMFSSLIALGEQKLRHAQEEAARDIRLVVEPGRFGDLLRDRQAKGSP